MEKLTNEKSLAVMDYSIFAKMRRFFVNFFNKKQNSFKDQEQIEENIEINEEPVKKTRKLFDYDAEVDDSMPENIQEKDNTEENVENAINYDSEEATKSQVSEEKEELERKLMNYYASIKNGI